MRSVFFATLAMLVLTALAGCEGGLVLGGKSVAVQDGQMIRSSGYVVSTYPWPFEAVCRAVDDTLAEMRATVSEKTVKIGKARVLAVIQEEKVTVEVEFKDKDKTDVSILVGLGGSNIASRLIHDRLRRQLEKTSP
ncbi:MAG: DUF3568 family protein [Pseudomonadota bacterium]|nr:DUF3568 family protein [Pseudomonadota bacterium]